MPDGYFVSNAVTFIQFMCGLSVQYFCGHWNKSFIFRRHTS